MAFDLNLLRVFEALLEEGGVTRAGQRLGLTQSAVSHALNRLRYIAGDPLFVRGAKGMQPTARALEIGAKVRLGLAELDRALEPSSFTPATTTRRFSLAASGYICTVLGPALLDLQQASAPGAEVRITPMSSGLVDALDSGRLDLALGSFGRTPVSYAKALLFEDEFVWVMRQGAAEAPLTLERLAAASHVMVAAVDDPETGRETVIDQGLERRVMLGGGDAFHSALAARGLRRTVGVSVPDGHSALWMVARSDMAALAPRRLAAAYAEPLGLAIFTPPHPSPPLEVHMVWRKDRDSPAAAWLRDLLRTSAAA